LDVCRIHAVQSLDYIPKFFNIIHGLTAPSGQSISNLMVKGVPLALFVNSEIARSAATNVFRFPRSVLF
jgi:hypothetical protein